MLRQAPGQQGHRKQRSELQPEHKDPQEDQGLSPTFKAHCPASHSCSGWESGQKYKLRKYAILQEEEYEAGRGPGHARGSHHV